MHLLLLVLLVSIPLVSPSYHIPKLGRYHTFLRIGKRNFDEPCNDPALCAPNQTRHGVKCVVFFNGHLCWPQMDEHKSTGEHDLKPGRVVDGKYRDNS